MNNSTRPVGMFDSGIGGFSIWRAVRRLLPCEDLTYIADNAYFPYGTREAAEIRDRARYLAGRLIEAEAKAIVVACNTATVHALADLRSVYPTTPFIGVVPVVRTLARVTRSDAVAVLCTERTAESDYTRDLVRQFAAGKQVTIVNCSGLEDLIESGDIRSDDFRRRLDDILLPLVAKGIDSVGLNCTHYALVRRQMKSILGPRARLYDPARPVARRVRYILREGDMLAAPHATVYRFGTTGDVRLLESAVRRHLRLRPVTEPPGLDGIAWLRGEISSPVAGTTPSMA